MMQFSKVLLPLTLLGACASVPSEPQVSFDSIARGVQSGLSEPGVHVARDAASWSAIWARHSSNALSASNAPTVDFDSRMALFVTDGPRPSAGWSLAVECACVEKGELVLCARVAPPDPNLLQAQVVTVPFELISITRSDLPIRLRILRDEAK